MADRSLTEPVPSSGPGHPGEGRGRGAAARPAPHPRPLSPQAGRGGISRAAIVAETRSWIATPYRHQASLKGVGCDCLGLVRGVWRAFYGGDAEPVPAYSSDWGQTTGEETMLAAARRHLIEVPVEALEPANIVVFRMHRRAIAKHAGILTAKDRFVHAYQPMRVAENWLDDGWAKRIAAVFEFPGVASGE